jgi:hypothetical protein
MKNKSIITILLFFVCFSAFSQKTDSNKISRKTKKELKINKNLINIVYFLEPSCPISQKYQFRIKEIHNEFETYQPNTIFVFPNQFSDTKTIINFAAEIDQNSMIIVDKEIFYTREL